MERSDRSDLFLSGERFLHRRHYPSALSCFESDLKTSPDNRSTAYRIDLLIHIGNIHAEMGSQTQAQHCYQEVLSLQKENSDPHAVGVTLVNLGNLARERGQRSHAAAYYLEAKDQLEHCQDMLSLAVLYSNLGLLAQDENELDQAILHFKTAIELHKKTGFEAGLAQCWGQLARLFVQDENDADAETCFNYATTHFEQLADPLGAAEGLRGLAQIYERRKDFELKQHCFVRIVEIHQRFGLSCPDEDRYEASHRMKRAIEP